MLRHPAFPFRRVLALAIVLAGFAGCDRSETTVSTSSPSSPNTSLPSSPQLAYGTKISFAQGGNSDPYKVQGWSKTEEKFTWSEGTSCQLRIPVAPTNDNIALKVRMAALIHPPELPFQPVEVWVNDQKIAEWQVGDTAELVAPIPPAITKSSTALNITFKTPKATSPKALGQSADPRVLGICCLDLELSRS